MARRAPPRTVREPHHRDTVWKLVDAACEQLAEMVRATRVPTVLLLTSSLFWFMTIYDVEFGMFTHSDAVRLREDWAGAVRLEALVQRDDDLLQDAGTRALAARALHLCTAGLPQAWRPRLTLAELAQCTEVIRASGRPDAPTLKALDALLASRGAPLLRAGLAPQLHRAFDNCAQRFGAKADAPLDRHQILACRQRAEKGLDGLFARNLEQRFVVLPLNLGRTSVNDLSIIGTLVLLLLLVWTTLAVQAESEAIRAFVTFSRDTRTGLFGSARKVTLVPTPPVWQAEHLAFAFHAVRARLFNAFGRKRSTIKWTNGLILLLPVAVLGWDLWTDLAWLLENRDVESEARMFRTILGRTLLQGVLAAIMLAVWLWLLQLVNVTSDLVHAWSIATDRKWTSEWDESRDEMPRPLAIDLGRGEVIDAGWLEPPATVPVPAG